MTPTTGQPENRQPVLSVKHLTTSFRGEDDWLPVVRDLSFDVYPGETLAIVGESGSGKSVTSLSVMRLLKAQSSRIEGEVWLNQRSLLALSDKQMRDIRGNDMAMIFQEPMTSLNPTFSIGRQIAESLKRHRGMSSSEARAETLRLLEKVRIPNATKRFDEYPHQFSGGMRQRVMIAMALACEPDLVIADEPTTALDVTIQAQILDLLADLRTRLGTAILLITHDLGVVAETCDDVAVMYAGRIVERAPAAELFANPRHPYTIGLLAARPGPRHAGPLKTIPGMVPAPQDFPAGCRFHPRCAFARLPDCAAAPPALDEFSPGHFVRCPFAAELGAPRPPGAGGSA